MQDAEDSVMSTLILAYWCACVVHVGGPLPRPSVCVSVPADETLRQVLQRVVVSDGNRALRWRRDTDTPVVREMDRVVVRAAPNGCQTISPCPTRRDLGPSCQQFDTCCQCL